MAEPFEVRTNAKGLEQLIRDLSAALPASLSNIRRDVQITVRPLWNPSKSDDWSDDLVVSLTKHQHRALVARQQDLDIRRTYGPICNR